MGLLGGKMWKSALFLNNISIYYIIHNIFCEKKQNKLLITLWKNDTLKLRGAK